MRALVLLLFLTPAFANPPAAPDPSRTYEYRVVNSVLQQKIGCTLPTHREDGTAFDPATEMDNIKWHVLLNPNWSGGWQTEIVYGVTTSCEFWMPIHPGMPDFDLTATTTDLSSPPLESRRSPALHFRYR